MTTANATRRMPRAPLAILGAREARRHLTRTRVIARQLDTLAPGTVHVRTVPVWTDRSGERRLAHWVGLADADGSPVAADRAAHGSARGLLARMFPATDWTRALAYDARTGDITLDEPRVLDALGSEGAR